MQSIDRKLARLAREIEEAKPKGLSLDDFRFIKHPFPDGTFDGGGKAVHTFNVGDKVRHKNYPSDDFGVVLEVAGDLVHFVGANGSFYHFADRLELVPEEKPATPEPVADADGWIEWSGGECPVSPDSTVEIRWCDGLVRTYPAWCVYGWEGAGCILAYRLVK